MDNDHIPIRSTKSKKQKLINRSILNQDEIGTLANKQKPPPLEKKRTPNMRVKSFAKVNIFLKITGTRGKYHEILSRFMTVNTLFDDVTIIQTSGRTDEFSLEGKFGCSLQNNLIYKTYMQLLAECHDPDYVRLFYRNHKVAVEKRIPEFGGFGGGPSNAAAFIVLSNRVCSLGMTLEEMCCVGANIGADVPFFIHGFESANVSGIGEIVEQFPENALDLDLICPDIQCNTGLVYEHYRNNFYEEITLEENISYRKMKSIEVMKSKTASEANDLFKSTVCLYPELEKHVGEGWLMSGTGSSMFSLRQR
ncbi:hypothetical protein FSP39_025091 [Pinctada imbricata]|uniref:GHMP kinase N-terminal domain-containing protein n=1 Tax=Pinctada imbricata TaxID=66713 RepID=A0AA88YPZ2_PINIB|nr:hypothetical protein FSP39_025091 [Pinctada imbricata]